MNDLIDWSKFAKPTNLLPVNDVQIKLPPFRELFAFVSINNEEIATQNAIPYDENNVPKN